MKAILKTRQYLPDIDFDQTIMATIFAIATEIHFTENSDRYQIDYWLRARKMLNHPSWPVRKPVLHMGNSRNPRHSDKGKSVGPTKKYPSQF